MDPLSAVPKNLGILSFGIHITRSWLRFLSAHNNQDTDFAKVAQTIKRCNHDLQTLRRAEEDRRFLLHEDSNELLLGLFKAMKEPLDALDQLLTDLEFDTKDAEGSNQVAERRTSYVIQKSTIEKVEENIDAINTLLSFDFKHVEVHSGGEAIKGSSSAPEDIHRGVDYQSDMSDAPSIFSLLSKQSTAFTTNTHLTAKEIHSAIDELAGIFLEDLELGIIYREAILGRQIDRPRLVRNFRRLLKRFALNLKEECGEAIDLDIANLISSKAGLIAEKVGSEFEQQYSKPDTTSAREKVERDTQDGSSADEDDDDERERALDREFPALVSHGRSFIKGSIAFQQLQEAFKNFVIPPKLNELSNNEPFAGVRSWVIRTICGMTPNFRAWKLNHEAPVWTKRVSILEKLLKNIGLVEKSVPNHHQRFRWTNRHGRKLYDDYIVHEPGAIQALQEYLDATTVKPGSENGGTSSSQARASSRAANMYTPNSISRSAAISTSLDITDQSMPTLKGFGTDTVQQDIELGALSTRPLRLLSCIERKGRPIKLHQEIITQVTDDRQLFHVLRKIYDNHRRTFESFWSLRTLHSIHFMKFWYGGHGLVDVRCHPEPCEIGKPCGCVPPANIVVPQGEEYACQPIPSKRSPPWGPNILMDFFRDPDSRKSRADTILQQFPKKLSTEADLDKEDMTEAWGILFREDWDWKRIWVVLGIALFPPSLLFGILWQDIQGAFGVASWWMAGATIAVGIIGTST